MAHVIMGLGLLVVAVVVALLLFVFWLILQLVRGATRLFLGPGLKRVQTRAIAQRAPLHTRNCSQDSCRSMNPAEARFCRRCGRRMDEPQRAPVRRVAML